MIRCDASPCGVSFNFSDCARCRRTFHLHDLEGYDETGDGNCDVILCRDCGDDTWSPLDVDFYNQRHPDQPCKPVEERG